MLEDKETNVKNGSHCFDNVTAVLFVTSLSEYDLRCYEDDQTLRYVTC